MDSFKNAFEVITSPFSGFKQLKKKKTFWLPFLLTLLLTTGTFTYYSFNVDLKYVITQQIERSGKLNQLPKEQVDKLIDMQAKMGKYFMPIGAFVGSFVYLLFVGLYLFVMAKIFTSDLTFKDALVITGNSFFIYFLSSIIFLIILLVTDFKTSPINALMPSNLSYYFSYDTLGKKMYTLFSKIDIFNFWFVWLLGAGFHVFTEESLTKSMLTVFVPYILLILLAVLMA